MTRARLLLAIIAATLTGWGPYAVAEKPVTGIVIAGWLERIAFPGHDFLVKAKLDTGAKTSSIYAKDITRFERKNEPWVGFTLVMEDTRNRVHQLIMEEPLQRNVLIKNHDGDHDDRPVVELEICFNGYLHQAEFTLADRHQFHYPVLLGRRFLGGVAVIDSSETFTTQGKCP
ncbi:MAG: RimK/LysX family protein [Immundisolibacteraceae bacterium]|nr:RimK/LysX family protein [Immundisolibacteraceae bacterium]